MAIRTAAARVAVAVSLGTLLVVPVAAVAWSGGAGIGARPGFAGSAHRQRHRAFNALPYGGFVAGAWPSAAYGENTIPAFQGREVSPEPPRVLTCHHSQETITVRAEGGGEQQVRITRC